MNIYLAGGMKTNWQDRARARLPQAKFYDPRDNGTKIPDEFTMWDLEALDQSDMVFAYLEESNPGGFGLALEVGYAKAQGKRVILIDEKYKGNGPMKMIWAASDVKFDNFDDGLQYLQRLRPLT